MAELTKSKYPKIQGIKKLDETTAAIVSKLVKRNDGAGGGNGSNSLWRNKAQINTPDVSVVNRMAHRISSNNHDADNLFQTLPEMDLARQILVSAILAPSDLVTTELFYQLTDNQLDDNITGPMLREIKAYFDSVYRIKDVLYEMVSDALFMRGSYPLLVLPESSIDQVINSTGQVGLESVGDQIDNKSQYRNYGILGSGAAVEGERSSLESFSSGGYKPDTNIELGMKIKNSANGNEFPIDVYASDNPNLLKNPMLVERLRQQRVAGVYRTSLEAAGAKVTNRPGLGDIEKLFYAQRQYAHVPLHPILTSKQLDKENVGHPLTMHLPSESVIPVHIPGNPRHHIGYFVLVDIDGNPLHIPNDADFYGDIRGNLANRNGINSQLVQTVQRSMDGEPCRANSDINQMVRTFASVVENDLHNRLRSGAMSGVYEIAAPEEVMRLMFSRALQRKRTNMLYVPSELLTYVAFDYNCHGVGKSLLEDGKILASLRSVLLFATTMGAVKNATGTQTITVTVPEEDGDPYGTVEAMLNEYARVQGDGFPLADTNPVDLISHLQNAGKNIVVEGNAAFPGVKFDVEAREGTQKTIDPAIDEDLKKRHIQTFGITPEMMEAASGADFATQIVANHLMTMKRVIQLQEQLEPHLTKFHRTYVVNSGFLMKRLDEIIEENKKHLTGDYKDKKDLFIADFIAAFRVGLPRPQANKLENQMKNYDLYTESLTKVLDAYFSEEMLDSTQHSGLYESVPAAKKAILGIMQRRWLRDNAVLPEIDIFNTFGEEGGPGNDLMTEMEEYSGGMLDGLLKYLQKVNKSAKARRKRMEKAGIKGEGDMGGDEEEDLPGSDPDINFDDELPPEGEEEEELPLEEEELVEEEEEEDPLPDEEPPEEEDPEAEV